MNDWLHISSNKKLEIGDLICVRHKVLNFLIKLVSSAAAFKRMIQCDPHLRAQYGNWWKDQQLWYHLDNESGFYFWKMGLVTRDESQGSSVQHAPHLLIINVNELNLIWSRDFTGQHNSFFQTDHNLKAHLNKMTAINRKRILYFIKTVFQGRRIMRGLPNM